MSLPVPNLDDRRFQDLVDEAKRRVQQRCPEWTDHNVADPGVTLIETFAFMVDQLLYRVNRVPELHYLRFLELVGVRLFPPTAARCDLTFWLAAAQPAPVTVPAGAPVASTTAGGEEPVVFQTETELAMVPCTLRRAMTWPQGGRPTDQTEQLSAGAGLTCFSQTPAVGDALLFGLSSAVPGCAVLLRLECRAEGVGVDPRDPPLVWEAWDGSGWAACEVERDTTGGLNRAGDVVLHVPPGHTASLVARQRAGWLRCRLLDPAEGQTFYRASPRIAAATAATIGGTVAATHAEAARDEVIGVSEGVPGQRFRLARRPLVVADEPLLVQVAGGEEGWQEWREVPSFAHSGPADQHVVVDRVSGEVQFGPAIRQPGGGLRQHGAIPPKGARVRVPEYRTGGGQRGNVARGLLQVQRDPVPFVSSVTNRAAASGGVDGESVAAAAARGPLLLRTRDRAVTVADYEYLAREAAPDAARVHCVPVASDPAAGGGPAGGGPAGGGPAGEPDTLRVLVVPAVPDPLELPFADLRTPDELLARIAGYLAERRCLGARISVEPPLYQGVTVVAKLRARPRVSEAGLRARATQALYRYLNPIIGGPDGTGWPFGRPVQSGEVFAVLQQLSGVELVDEVRLFAADPVSGKRGGETQRLELAAYAVVYSFGHQIRVTEA